MGLRQWFRRGVGVALAIGLMLVLPAQAQEQLLRIGSGGVAGTYFPVAQLIATALSSAPGCRAEDCGVPGLLAVAQVSNGSVANVRDLTSGSLEAGLAQADIAYLAYTGRGPFEGERPRTGLRAIANLYPEAMHLVASRESGIHSLDELRGKRVSLEEPGSGSLRGAQLLLRAYGLSETQMQALYLKPQPAAEAMRAGRLDAFFLIAGYPVKAISELAAAGDIRLVPIDGPRAETLLEQEPFFSRTVIPADCYRGIAATPTLAVGAQLLVDMHLGDELAYRITRRLWSDYTLRLLREGHPKGQEIRLERALAGLAVPLHPGAERYYREIGLLGKSAASP